MFEHKYSMYITDNRSRFAEPEEIMSSGSPVGGKRKPPSGLPLYSDGKRLYVDGSDSHSIIIGPTGCKKTRVTAYSALSSIIDAGESAVVNDPKGEIYARTAEHARQKGCTVRVLNFRDPTNTDKWNPLQSAYRFYHAGKEQLAMQLIDDFASSMCKQSIERTNDRYWGDSSKMMLMSLSLLLLDSVKMEYFNLSNIIQMCYQKYSDHLKAMLDRIKPDSVAAYGLHAVVDLEASGTKSCIYSVLLSIMSPFMKNPALLDMLCRNNTLPYTMGLTPTIVYIIYPDEKLSLNFLVNAFLTQSYEELILCADRNGGKLPVRVNYLLDEFSNLPRVNLFENRISEARGRNIRYFIYIQSYSQLKDKYADNARTILSNCGNWLCFSSREMEFLNEISAICGREVDYNGREHPLISPSEMQHLQKRPESADVLILRHGMYPFITALPDIDSIPEYAAYPIAETVTPAPCNEAKYISFEQWLMRIESGMFKYPFESEEKSIKQTIRRLQ